MFLMSRPRFWMYTAGPFLLGSLAASVDVVFTYTFWLQFLFFLIPANFFLYGINDIADQDTDKYNSKKKDKERGFSSSHTVYVTISFLFFVVYAFFLRGGSLLLLGLFFFLSFAYSMKPFRFKQLPFLDSFSNVLYIIPGLLGYYFYSGSLPSISIIIASWCWVWAMHLYSAIPDIIPDKKAHLLTTAVLLGRNKSLLFCGLLWTITTVVSGLWFLFIYSIMCIISYYGNEKKIYWYFPLLNMVIGMILTGYVVWLM